MDNGGRRHHTAAMGPHPRQQSTQQSSNIICDGSTSLKLEKKIITSNITNNARRVDVNEQRRRCSNATMGAVQPTGRYRQFRRHVTAPNDIFDEGWRGGAGVRGFRRSNLSATEGGVGVTGVVTTQRCLLFDGLYVSEKVWSPFDDNMVLD